MDLTKYKSVTIDIGTWKELHKIANKDMRSVTRTIEYLVALYKKKERRKTT
jgi:macrodomain Ter protein organizer (MatP/YcbG family)|tara:strand:+ start:6792 stop:6944 length:153 start_codon:yes stop_codon:yes gene_type:complete